MPSQSLLPFYVLKFLLSVDVKLVKIGIGTSIWDAKEKLLLSCNNNEYIVS
jgi:hypothetical protein